MALHQLLCGVTALILLSTRGNCQTTSPSAHSPSAHSSPSHSPPSHSPPTHSSPSHSPPTHSPPTHSPSAHSSPSHSPPPHSSPSHSPPSHSPPTHSPPPLPKCGMAVEHNKWMDLNGSSPYTLPWTVRLYNNFGFCAGSLISEEWVLTTFICASLHRAENITVVLGRSGPNQNVTHREVERVECHPRYNPYTYDNDICLLKLSHPVEFNDYIQPVCLASAESTFHTGTKGLVTGWGITDNGSRDLQELDVQIVGNNECRCTYPQLSENMMCALAKGTCEGQGGGALVTQAGVGQWIGAGMLTFGKESCEYPGGFTRLSEYEDFIRSVTNRGHSNGSSYSLPGFITYRSMGKDSDSHFTCPTAPPPTTEYPPHTKYPPQTTEGGKGGGSIFDSGENLIRFSHFTHFFSLGGFLVLSFYALV